MSPNELLDTEYHLIESLWNNISVIEAQEQMKKLTVADWPNMKKSSRSKLHKDLYSQAYPTHLRKKNYVSADDLAKVLGR